jgi:DNA-binding MarR family transcriptional regulator
MNHKLTPSQRLIRNVISQSPTPVHAGTLLQETGVSIHTLLDSLTRLARLALITKIDSPDGPRYVTVTPTESEVR